MPHDIGPDMLRNLDAQLAAGRIDVHTYEARKAEVVDLIRRGRAVVWTPAERAVRIVGGLILLALGVWLLLGAGSSGAMVGILLGALGVAAGLVAIRSGVRGSPS